MKRTIDGDIAVAAGAGDAAAGVVPEAARRELLDAGERGGSSNVAD
jgi:hypothetical protein